MDYAGSIEFVLSREAVTASDVADPSGTAQAGSVPVTRRSQNTHVAVFGSATTGSPTVLVTIWGYSKQLNRWFVLGQLNGGGALTPSTKNPNVATGQTRYAEVLTSLTGWDRLYAQLTSIAGSGQAVTVHFGFEE